MEAKSDLGEWKWLQKVALLMTISNVLMPFFASLIAFSVLFRYGWRAIATPLNIAYLWLSLWMIFTTFTAFNFSIAAGGLANFIPYFLLAATTSYIVRTPEQFRQFLWLLIVGSICVSGFGLIQAIVNRPDWILPQIVFESYPISMGFSGDRRIQSIFGHFNETAIYLLMLLPINLHFAIGKVKTITKSQQIITAIALAMNIAVLIMTGSRNAWTLAVIGSLLITIYYRQWKLLSLGLLCTLLVAWGIFGQKLGIGGEIIRSLLPEGFVQRLSSAIDPSMADYGSTNDRLNAWNYALYLIKTHPIQGWGLRNFPAIAQSTGYDLRGLPHEHNLFFAIATGSGIPALIAIISITFWNIKAALKPQLIDQTEGLVIVTAIAIVLFGLSGLLDVVLYDPRISMLLWYLLGSLYGLALFNRVDLHSSHVEISR
ncbi:MAG: O-antigen ligase family protein [Pseudanabaenaceae cyanobacterium bins.39]|nr:O-antigen ligase family protein [Pseudanabaenaceae cyanobacterium bins.39]